jgi:hypothetical protein
MPRVPVIDREPVIAPPPSAIISSAAFLSGDRNHRKPEAWQSECWYYRDTIGELRYAVSWFSNALSRAKIKPARYDAKGTLVPIDAGEEVDALNTILGGLGGQSEMLKAMGEHFFVAGEWYVVGRGTRPEDDTPDDEVWEVISSEEMKKKGDKWWIEYGGNDKYEIKDSDSVFRCWTPHPRRKMAPDSPVRAILGTLSEIELLSLHVKKQARSRLAGAGVFFISNETTFATTDPDNEGTDAAAGADPFMVALGRAMAAALADPSSPEALVPIFARMPGDQIDKVRHINFWSEFDAAVGDMRDRAIRRAALGIDLPPEVLLGTADVNHWGAWQIDESTIKAHIEPALEVIASCLTRILRKVLGDDDVLTVFDTSSLRLRPNRSKEAVELFDRGEINAKALRRETGFSEADDMEDDERKQWYLQKIAAGSATPAMVEAALRLLGVDFPVTETGPGEMREARPDPSIRDHPELGPPPQADADAQRASLEATCDALVVRALERAGNRIRATKGVRPDGVPVDEMHLLVPCKTSQMDALLAGAWTLLPRLIRSQSVNHTVVERQLDAYVRSLLIEQQPHNPDVMMRFLDAGLSG